MQERSNSIKDTRQEKAPAVSLCLYVMGHTRESLRALVNLLQLAAEHSDSWRLDVIDALEDPLRASLDRVYDLPALIMICPGYSQQIKGNLGDREHVLRALRAAGMPE